MGRGEGNGPRAGLGQEKERGELVPRGKVGLAGLCCWDGLDSLLLFLSSFLFFFLSKLHPNLIEFKLKFEFKPHLLTQ